MSRRDYLVCPRRAGRPRVAVEVCRACRGRQRCPAWRDYRMPPLFPELYRCPGA